MIQQIALQVFEQVMMNSACRVAIVSSVNMHAENWLIEKELIAAFSQKGVTDYLIKTNDENPDFTNINCGFIISYQPIDISVDYKQSMGKSNNDDLVQRTANVELYIKILNEEEELIYSDTIKKSYMDTINKNRQSLVENMNYPFTCGKSLKTSIFTKFIEPAIGIGVAGAILYMFYSFRSK